VRVLASKLYLLQYKDQELEAGRLAAPGADGQRVGF
jgi:hypothetical protein